MADDINRDDLDPETQVYIEHLEDQVQFLDNELKKASDLIANLYVELETKNEMEARMQAMENRLEDFEEKIEETQEILDTELDKDSPSLDKVDEELDEVLDKD